MKQRILEEKINFKTDRCRPRITSDRPGKEENGGRVL